MNFGDIPYGPIREALNTIWGRLGLLLGTIVLASILAAWSVSGSILNSWQGPFLFLGLFFFTFFYSYGLVCWPLVLVFGICFVRSEWRWRWLLLPLLLTWWNLHEAFDFTMNRSAGAKAEKQMQEIVERINREQTQKNRKSE